MHKNKKLWQAIASLFALLLSLPSYAAWTLNMSQGATDIQQEIYHLHMVIFLICVAIGVVVFGIMIYSIIFHRKSKGAVAATFHEHLPLEIVWTIIPFLILVIMAVPATKVLMAMYDAQKSDVTIKITGYQWKWHYEYLNEGVKFFSNLSTPLEQIEGKQKKDKWFLLEVDNELVIPIHKKVRFLVTSNDVLHSWWLPAFGVKRDAIPGFIHESWARVNKTGVYRGQCAELCGVGHAFMPIVVRAVTEADYEKWVAKKMDEKRAAEAEAGKSWPVAKLMKVGKAAYDKYCAACHKPNGTGQPPIFPALKGSSIAVGKPISRHIDLILHGVQGTAMQAFGNQLTDSELAAIVTYERNAWGNNTGDAVQPVDVKARRNVKSGKQPLSQSKLKRRRTKNA